MRFLWQGVDDCHVYRIGENSLFIHDCNITVIENGLPINYQINEVEASSDTYQYALVTYNSELNGNELTEIEDGIYHLWIRYEYEITPKVKYLDVVGLPVTGFGKLYFWDSELSSVKYVFGKAVSDLGETSAPPVYFDIQRNLQTSYKRVCKITVSGANIEVTDFYRNASVEPQFNLYFGEGQLD